MGCDGSRYLSRSNSSLRVKSDLYQMVSWRVIPVRCDSMSRIVTLALRSSLKNWMSGTNWRTGLSQSSFPSSTSRPVATAVKSFVLEAIGTVVFGVNVSLRPTSRTPSPLAKTSLSFATTPTPRPGTFQSLTIASRYASKPFSFLSMTGSAAPAMEGTMIPRTARVGSRRRALRRAGTSNRTLVMVSSPRSGHGPVRRRPFYRQRLTQVGAADHICVGHRHRRAGKPADPYIDRMLRRIGLYGAVRILLALALFAPGSAKLDAAAPPAPAPSGEAPEDEKQVAALLFPRVDLEALKGKGPSVLPIMVRLYERSDEERRTTLATAFYGLGWKSPDARRVLMRDAHTQNQELRLQVQWALGRVSSDQDVVDVLGGNMRSDANPLFREDRKSTRLNSSHVRISYAVFCLKKKKKVKNKHI